MDDGIRSTLADREILQRYAAKQFQEGFRLLFHRYYHRAEQLARRRVLQRCTSWWQLGCEARDIAHEVLIKVHISLCRHADPLAVLSVSAMVYRRTGWEVAEHLSGLAPVILHSQVSELSPPETSSALPEDPHFQLEESRLLADFDDCVGELAERTRQALRLSLLGLKLREIAERMGFAFESGASKAIERATVWITRCLERKGYPTPTTVPEPGGGPL